METEDFCGDPASRSISLARVKTLVARAARPDIIEVNAVGPCLLRNILVIISIAHEFKRR